MRRTWTDGIEPVRERIGIPIATHLGLVKAVGGGTHIIPTGQVCPCVNIVSDLITVHYGILSAPAESLPAAYQEALSEIAGL